MRIIFLDIDGVLLPRSAWRMRENAAVKESLRAGVPPASALVDIKLDPAAVAFILRLCEHAGAFLVVHSHWRYVAGEDTMGAVLVASGIPESLFHPDLCGVVSPFSREKFRDLDEWLHDHRHEVSDYVVIDDDALQEDVKRAVAPDADIGFVERDYLLACHMFGCKP